MSWPDEIIRRRTSCGEPGPLAEWMYERTCRVDFDEPGFCLVQWLGPLDSTSFRRRMVELKEMMSALHQQRTGDRLVYRMADRFDQQESTRLHLDGGPEEGLLMLGYEPTEARRAADMVDFSRSAFEEGLSPEEFLARYNPMFAADEEPLRRHAHRLTCSCPGSFQILCINNSRAAHSATYPRWQGVLHAVTVPRPQDRRTRIVDSTLIVPSATGSTASGPTAAGSTAPCT